MSGSLERWEIITLVNHTDHSKNAKNGQIWDFKHFCSLIKDLKTKTRLIYEILHWINPFWCHKTNKNHCYCPRLPHIPPRKCLKWANLGFQANFRRLCPLRIYCKIKIRTISEIYLPETSLKMPEHQMESVPFLWVITHIVLKILKMGLFGILG